MVDLLTTARFTMRADILKPGNATPANWNPDNYGQYVNNQDPLTGDIISVWVPFPDDPNTPDDEHVELGTIKCLARGIVPTGMRTGGSGETFGSFYQNVDFVRLWTPPNVRVTKRDRITNIRSAAGVIFWNDAEENEDNPQATIFNVNGVTPQFDPFNKHISNFVFLERADASDG